jgi:hypothetical protein
MGFWDSSASLPQIGAEHGRSMLLPNSVPQTNAHALEGNRFANDPPHT